MEEDEDRSRNANTQRVTHQSTVRTAGKRPIVPEPGAPGLALELPGTPLGGRVVSPTACITITVTLQITVTQHTAYIRTQVFVK